MLNASEFLYNLSNIEDTDRKLGYIFEFIDDCFLDGNFGLPDEILDIVSKDVGLFDTTELIGFLTIAWPANDNGELTNFNELYNNIETLFRSQFNEERVTGLLTGLKPDVKRQTF